jgi:hypothetical protein
MDRGDTSEAFPFLLLLHDTELQQSILLFGLSILSDGQFSQLLMLMH